MRRGVLSLVAMALAIPVLYGAIRQHYPLETAAIRLLVLATAVGFLDHYLGPLMDALLRTLSRKANDPARPANRRGA